jgi:hypothetical protein
VVHQSLAALRAHRKAHPGIGSALLLPSSGNPEVPVSRHLSTDWLKRFLSRLGSDETNRRRVALLPPNGLGSAIIRFVT